MSRRWWRRSGPLLALVAFGGFWALSQGKRPGGQSARGFAEAIEHAVAPAVGGRIREVRVQLGQVVRAGEVVAVMDPRPAEARLELARRELAVAQAALAAEEVVQSAALERVQLQAVRLRVEQSRDRAQLAELEEQLARAEQLSRTGLVSATDLEQARLLRAGLSAAVAAGGMGPGVVRRASLGGGGAVGSVSDRLALEQRLAPRREEVRLREAEVRVAALGLEEATLRAPVDGTVSLILHPGGDVVGAGVEVVRLTRGREGVIECWLPERRAGVVAPGQAAVVRGARFLEPSFGARVLEVSPEIQEVPLRARSTPGLPAWGRRVVLQAWPRRPLLPGETLNVGL